jgi:hypothetical protein
VNYFNLVQPQLQFNSAIGQLGVQQTALGQAISNPAISGLTTGHPVMFGNYGHYYSSSFTPSSGGGMGISSGFGVGGMRAGGMGMGGMGMGMGGMGMGMGGMGMGGMGMGGMGMGGMGMGGMGMGGMGSSYANRYSGR